MEIIYKSEAIEDLRYWKKAGNLKIQEKISKLITDICQHPTTGIGKPEMLKYELTGMWSRRINQEHRIINGASWLCWAKLTVTSLCAVLAIKKK